MDGGRLCPDLAVMQREGPSGPSKKVHVATLRRKPVPEPASCVLTWALYVPALEVPGPFELLYTCLIPTCNLNSTYPKHASLWKSCKGLSLSIHIYIYINTYIYMYAYTYICIHIIYDIDTYF